MVIGRVVRAAWFWRVVLVLYVPVLIAGTHWPQLQIEGPLPRTDIWLHVCAYAPLAGFVLLSRLLGPPGSVRAAVRAALILVPYAVIDEGTQAIPGINRVVAIEDLAANIGGLSLGIVVTAVIARAVDTSGGSRAAAVERSGFVAHARTFAGVTIVSRVFGLARDATCAAVFGASPTWSAFVTAFVVPNLFRRLFGEGSLSAAFVPVYTKLRRDDPETAQKLAFVLTLIVLGATTVIAALGIGGIAVYGYVAQPADGETRLFLLLAAIMLPFMPAICATAALGAVLQVHGRFGPVAAMPILLNAAMISAIVLGAIYLDTDVRTTAVFLAVGVTVAGVLQFVWSLVELSDVLPLRRSLGDAWRSARAPLARTARTAAPIMVGLGAMQLGLLIDGLIAGWPVVVGPTVAGVAYPLDESAAAVLYYAQRLYQLPIGVFVVALAAAIFPALSRAADRPTEFAEVLRRGVRTSVFLGAPAAVGLAAVAPSMVRVIYGGAKVGEEGGLGVSAAEAQRITAVVFAYAAAVVFAGLVQTLSRALYAGEKTRAPMVVALVTVGLNVVLNVVLIWPLGEIGLAVGTAVASAVQAGLLWRLARRDLAGLERGVLDRASAVSLGVSVASALAMGAAVVGAGELIAVESLGVRGGAAVTLGVGVAIGAMVYGALAIMMRRPELGWVLRRSADDLA